MIYAILLVASLVQSPTTSDAPPRATYTQVHRAADEALQLGDWETARAKFTLCIEQEPTSAASAYGLACALARGGKLDEAFTSLEQALQLGYLDANVVRWDADLAALREDPRFDKLVERMTQALTGPRPDAVLRRVTYDTPRTQLRVAISDDGTKIALGDSQDVIRILDSAQGTELRRYEAILGPIWELDFHPDGDVLAILTYGGELLLLALQTGKVTAELSLFDAGGWSNLPFGGFVEFDPTGQRLLVAVDERGGVLLKSDGTLIHRISKSLGSWFLVHPTWSHGGTRIAIIRGKSAVILDGLTGDELNVIPTNEEATSVALSSDGCFIAIGVEDMGRVLVHEIATGARVRTLEAVDMFPQKETQVSSVAFSPDGKWVAYSSSVSVTVTVESRVERKTLYRSPFLGGRMGEPVIVQFSPDGKSVWYAWSSGVGHFRHINLENGDETAHVNSRPPHISPSGAAVVVTYGGIARFDANTGAFLWHRVELLGDSHLMQSPCGYLAGDTSGLNDLMQLTGPPAGLSVGHKENISNQMGRLYDPKRVRAAIAGIALVPIR